MKYLCQLFSSALLIVVLVGVTNWFVDPFGMYWSPQVSGLNKVKPESGKRSRVVKAYRSVTAQPQVLIVGNSRVEMGIDPNHQVFEGREVYNLGMPGAGVRMQYDYAQNVIEASDDVELLIVSVDFLDFLIAEDYRDDRALGDIAPEYSPRLTALNGNGEGGSLFAFKEKLGFVLSLDASKASLATLLSQDSHTNSISAKGFNSADGYISILNYEGVKPLFTQKIDELSQRLLQKKLVLPDLSSDRPAQFGELIKFLEYAAEKQIRVRLFINPYHYSYLQLIYDSGYGELLQRWRLELTQVVSSLPGDNIQFWDFNANNQHIYEAVPLAAPQQKMEWYWEPAHYKKELGRLLLDAMFIEGSGENSPLGVRLWRDNVHEINRKEVIMIEQTKRQWTKLKSDLGYVQTSGK